MRFVMLVKADNKSESGALPDEKLLTAMGKYNEEMQKAGALLDLSGLHPSVRGARVRFSGGASTITDGPFAEAKDLVAGYWLIQVKSREEAIEWAKRVPFVDGEIEIRQVFELTDLASGSEPSKGSEPPAMGSGGEAAYARRVSPAVERAAELGKKLGKS